MSLRTIISQACAIRNKTCFVATDRADRKAGLTVKVAYGWGARIRTWDCQLQRLVSYRLTTPQ
jgi:hypothetical protein